MSEKLKHILTHYTEQPPAGVWERIDDALNERGLQNKLAGFAQIPPASAWEKITSGLDQKFISEPAHTTKKRWLYLSAAAVLLIVALVSIILNIQKDTNIPIATSQPANRSGMPGQKEQPALSQPSPNQFVTTPQEWPSIKNREVNQNKIAFRQSNIPVHAISRIAVVDNATALDPGIAIYPDEKIARLDFSKAEQYMVYSGDDRNFTRVAKKVVPLLLCETHNLPCKEHLQQLQNRISTASLSTGFSGFLDILSQLQENQ